MSSAVAQLESPQITEAVATSERWVSQGYTPTIFRPGLVQVVTFRLPDALPAAKMRQVLETVPGHRAHLRIDQYLDAGLGSCLLARPEFAQIVEDSLLHFDAERYRMLAWVVMPNHVHAIFEVIDGHPLGRVIAGWKSFTANQINKQLGKSGSLWQPDYFDRYMRDADHFRRAVEYVHYNPVRAGLAVRMKDWRFSSCRRLPD